ncbi:MAG: glycosyltransferase family 2 protein [Methanolinea sp.]
MSTIPMDHPKVSIITPSYNQGQFIEGTIKSILSQNYPNLEYIVLDGGSTDNSLKVLKKYSDFITYWKSERDKGQSDAINRGFRISTGEIVAWLNSDDIYCPGTIEKVVEFFQDNPDISIVYGDFLNLYEQDPSQNHIVHSGEFSLKKLIARDFIGQPTTFFRREALFDVGLLDETLQNSLDYDLFLKLGLKYRFGYIPEVLAIYRWHGESKSGSQEEKFAREDFFIIDRILKEHALSSEIVDVAYSHLIESIAISQMVSPAEISRSKKTNPSLDHNPNAVAVLEPGVFFDMIRTNYNLLNHHREIKFFKRTVECILDIFSIRYRKECNNGMIKRENRYKIYRDSLLWISNYLFIRGEYKKSWNIFIVQCKTSPKILFHTKSLKLFGKFLLTPRGVKYFDTHFNKHRSM